MFEITESSRRAALSKTPESPARKMQTACKHAIGPKEELYRRYVNSAGNAKNIANAFLKVDKEN